MCAIQAERSLHEKNSIIKTVFTNISLILVLLLITNSNGFTKTLQEHVSVLTKKADESSKQGNHALAFTYINQAIKLQPKNYNLYYTRAFILGRAGQYSKAIKEFSRFVKNDKFSHAIRFRADCFLAINQLQKAANDYVMFLRFAPKDGKVWSYLVETLALMGNRKAALDAVNRGLSTNSHWSDRLTVLQKQIFSGQKIIPHKPLSN
ncbi:TPR-repeat containing protein [Desulforapulum autotrophicum HRM2]|uniref:TPR-repeat containing protein n=1 Tax=Desulforapulum autotrophicum (strain ATCC 43914 / DSM 3382 / VKM B-1955 / HRM2) TaxID=177437 RepID=C0QCM0_DESAH|nr:tetratricopeptide repeat protein [Desulforapulum autotrophicum]ACN15097.1 TPR-repeat containing protein [Desulforapulum autotrophicum HRM2]